MMLDYVERLNIGIQSVKHKLPGFQVVKVSVYHDDFCPSPEGKACQCVPDIRFDVDGVTYTIDEEGDVQQFS